MNRISKNAVPEFATIEQEKEYWESHGLLDKSRAVKINKAASGTKRASFLNIRLSGEELTQLRDLAAASGTGPSTYTRILIKKTLDQKMQPQVKAYSKSREKVFLARDSDKSGSGLIDSNSIAVVEFGKNQIDSDIVKSIFETLQKTCRCKVLNPEDAGYTEIERIMKENP